MSTGAEVFAGVVRLGAFAPFLPFVLHEERLRKLSTQPTITYGPPLLLCWERAMKLVTHSSAPERYGTTTFDWLDAVQQWKKEDNVTQRKNTTVAPRHAGLMREMRKTRSSPCQQPPRYPPEQV